MPEFGDLSSCHGFLFTVTNKLPNKSLPNFLLVYSFEFLVVLMKLLLYWELYITLKFVVLDQVDKNAIVISRLDQFFQERSSLILYSRLKTLLYPPTHSIFCKEEDEVNLYSISQERKLYK